FLPATFPEVVDALRITMGWAWTYLIVAELVAAEHGIGSFILIAERYLRADRIIAAIITIGILGLLTDTLFAVIHRLAFPYVQKVRTWARSRSPTSPCAFALAAERCGHWSGSRSRFRMASSRASSAPRGAASRRCS